MWYLKYLNKNVNEENKHEILIVNSFEILFILLGTKDFYFVQCPISQPWLIPDTRSLDINILQSLAFPVKADVKNSLVSIQFKVQLESRPGWWLPTFCFQKIDWVVLDLVLFRRKVKAPGGRWWERWCVVCVQNMLSKVNADKEKFVYLKKSWPCICSLVRNHRGARATRKGTDGWNMMITRSTTMRTGRLVLVFGWKPLKLYKFLLFRTQ